MTFIRASALAAYGALAASIFYLGRSLWIYAQGVHVSTAFGLIGEMRHSPFSDLKWVTVVAQCGTKYEEFFKLAAEKCIPHGYGVSGGGYIDTGYPPMANWLLRSLQFPVEFTDNVALVSGFCLIAVMIIASRGVFLKGSVWALVMSVMILSFPFQHILEKANVDIFVYLIIVAAAVCISAQTRFSSIMTFFLSMSSIALKIFPIAGFVGWLAVAPLAARRIGWKINKFSILAVLLGIGIGSALSFSWLSVGSMYAEGGVKSFGLQSIGYVNNTLIDQFGLATARLMIRFLIIIKSAALIFGAYISYRVQLDLALQKLFLSIKNVFIQRFSFAYVTIMTLSWIGGYIATISYNHRQIFMLPSIVALGAMLESRKKFNPAQAKVALLGFGLAVYVIYYPIAYVLALNNYQNAWLVGLLLIEVIALPLLAGGLTIMIIAAATRQRIYDV
jgi:hypothetical protein